MSLTHNSFFKTIFAKQWDVMPNVLQRRYANATYSNDEVVVEGILDVHLSTWAKLLSPFLRICGALVPYADRNIPVTVRFNSELHSNAVWFNRTFNFANKSPYRFSSKWMPVKDETVIEFMRFGLGWKMRLHYDGKKVRMDHAGYIWQFGKYAIPLPFEFILGKGYATEEAISDDEFVMYFEILHPVFGKVFGYDGKFKLAQAPV